MKQSITNTTVRICLQPVTLTSGTIYYSELGRDIIQGQVILNDSPNLSTYLPHVCKAD